MVAYATAHTQSCTVAEALALHKNEDAVFIDVRESSELDADGQIPGAIHIPRGMLEFTLDPESPYYNPIFSKGNTFIFYCKSGSRSALASQVAMEMGLAAVRNLSGGFAEWSRVLLSTKEGRETLQEL